MIRRFSAVIFLTTTLALVVFATMTPLASTSRDLATASLSGPIVVSGTMPIYLAGRQDVAIPPLGGDLTGFPLGRNCTDVPCDAYLLESFPVLLNVSAGQVLSFTAAGGVDYYGFAWYTVPDGDPAARSEINSLGGISGYNGPDGALVGVFLDSQNPKDTTAPALIDFSSNGIGTNFMTLNPALGQVFFIGNGRAGLVAKTRQSFIAPAGATRLYLGIADAFAFNGDPGWYDDNKGAFTVTVGGRLTQIFLPLAPYLYEP
jgi:hypothetical protein